MKFEDIQESDLVSLIRDKADFEIHIEEEIVKFEGLSESFDFSLGQEMPPSTYSYSAEGMAQLVVNPEQSLHGMYLRFIVLVYAYNGAITYFSNDRKTYKAVVSWPNT